MRRRLFSIITLTWMLLCSPVVHSGDSSKSLVTNRGIVGLHLGPVFPITHYNQAYNGGLIKANWNNMLGFGLHIGFLLSEAGGVHLRFDSNFSFIDGAQYCYPSGCTTREFADSIKLFDFGPTIETNFSFLDVPFFFGPEFGVAVFLAFQDGMDTQAGMYIRPAFGIMYTILERFDIRFIPVRVGLIIPITSLFREIYEIQVTWEMMLLGRFRF